MKKRIFVDMDGTLCEFNYKGGVILPNHFEPNIFIDRKPVREIINKLELLQDDYRLCILSIAPSNLAVKEKEIWLNKYVPFITERYFVGEKSKKVLFLEELAGNQPRNEVFLIDDDHEILLEADTEGYMPIHTSTFLANNNIKLFEDTFTCSNCGDTYNLEEKGLSEISMNDGICIYCMEDGYER